MKKRLFFIFLIMYVGSSQAQFLFDTTKYIKFYNKTLWSVYQNYYTNSISLGQTYKKDSLINTSLNLNTESLKDIGFSYANHKTFVAINLFGILNEEATRKPKPQYANAVITVSDKAYLFETGFNWFADYYEKNSKNIVPKFSDSLPCYNYGKLRTFNTYLNYVHFNNYKNFSYNAA